MRFLLTLEPEVGRLSGCESDERLSRLEQTGDRRIGDRKWCRFQRKLGKEQQAEVTAWKTRSEQQQADCLVVNNKGLSAGSSMSSSASPVSPPASHCLNLNSNSKTELNLNLSANMWHVPQRQLPRRLAGFVSFSLLLLFLATIATTKTSAKNPNDYSFNSEQRQELSSASKSEGENSKQAIVWRSDNSNERYQDSGDAYEPDQDHSMKVTEIWRLRRQAEQESISDCQDPKSLWTHLGSNYPALTSYLIAQAKQQQHSNLRSQMSHSVARLLEEAERVVNVDTLRAFGGKVNGVSRQSNTISRLSLANPTYAKIVQQLHHRQRHEQQQDHFNRFQAQSGGFSGQQGPQPIAAHELGRLVHYPRELEQLGGVSASVSTGRTLDKIRHLNDAIERVSHDEAIESNRIPSGGDGWPQKQHPMTSPTPSTEESKSKFVYGNVLFRPQQQQPSLETSANRRLIQGLRRHQQQSVQQDATGDVAGSFNGTTGARLSNDAAARRPAGGWTSKSLREQQPQLEGADLNEGEELARQLGQVAVAPADGNNNNEPLILAGGGPDEEFEGQWLSAPIEQIQVRQLRRDDVTGDQVLIKHTTANPRSVFVVD